MAKTNKDQARDLAKAFRELSNALGEYRFEHWGELTVKQRNDIESKEWTLLNHSSDFVTNAVDIGFDDVQDSLNAISNATDAAKSVINTINDVKSVLQVAAALVMLGGAIASKDPKGILSAAGGLLNTSKEILAA